MNTFKKTVSSIAFNPGMFDQLAFYSHRLKQEESVRRLGLILIIFTMFIQLFAAMVPAEKSLAASDNDVIRGGISNIDQLRSQYYAHGDVRALYNRFGITGGDIDASGVSNISFNFKTEGEKGTRTIGRTNFQSTNDNYLGVFGGSKFYSRSAGEWQGSTPAYYFGQHKGTDNKMYHVWVLKDCGNIAYRPVNAADVMTSAPAAPAPPPAPPAPSQQHYSGGIAADCTHLEGGITIGHPFEVKRGDANGPVMYTLNPAPSAHWSFPINGVAEFGDGSTLKTFTLLDYDPRDPSYKTFNIYTATFQMNCTPPPPVAPPPPVPPTTPPPPAPPVTPPRLQKSVRNITQSLTSAKTLLTPARASDVVEYSLITTNTSDTPLTKHNVEDYIGDILNYSNLDETFLKNQGGSFDAKKKTITWSNQTIGPKAELKKNFRVTLKNPIPNTNRPNATAPDFDCKMQNGYGNEVIVKVDCSVVKNIEQLPNTGPGTAVMAIFGLSTISGYFVARARLLAKELGIIKRGWRA